MTAQSIKITGMFEIEIELPSGMSFQMFSVRPEQAEPKPSPETVIQAMGDAGISGQSLNGRIAEKVADFIKAAGPQGVTRHEITRKFGQIKSAPQREAVLKLLPDLLYRKSIDAPAGPKGRGAERWTYFYSQEQG